MIMNMVIVVKRDIMNMMIMNMMIVIVMIMIMKLLLAFNLRLLSV